MMEVQENYVEAKHEKTEKISKPVFINILNMLQNFPRSSFCRLERVQQNTPEVIRNIAGL